jgi:hypothetical protein
MRSRCFTNTPSSRYVGPKSHMRYRWSLFNGAIKSITCGLCSGFFGASRNAGHSFVPIRTASIVLVECARNTVSAHFWIVVGFKTDRTSRMNASLSRGASPLRRVSTTTHSRHPIRVFTALRIHLLTISRSNWNSLFRRAELTFNISFVAHGHRGPFS